MKDINEVFTDDDLLDVSDPQEIPEEVYIEAQKEEAKRVMELHNFIVKPKQNKGGDEKEVR